MYKKVWVIVLLLGLTGCGNNLAEFDQTAVVADGEEEKLYVTPEDYINSSVDMNFVLQSVPEYDSEKEGYFAFGYSDEANYASLKFSQEQMDEFDLKSGGTYNVKGVVETNLDNGFGKVYPRIVVSEVKAVDFNKAMKPSLYSYEQEQTKKIKDITFTLECVDFAKEETRVYFSIENNSNLELYTDYNRVLDVDGKEIASSEYSSTYISSHNTAEDSYSPSSVAPGEKKQFLDYYPAIAYENTDEIKLESRFKYDGTSDYIEGFEFDIPLEKN